jgi:MFS family permease
VFFVAAIASAFPPNVELLCAARFVIGLGVGTASFVAPMYISEQSPRHLRGGMTAFNQVMITFGIRGRPATAGRARRPRRHPGGGQGGAT